MALSLGGRTHADLSVDVQTNGLALLRTFREYSTKQLPFAAAVALTRTAEDARDLVRKRMRRYFKVRNPQHRAGPTKRVTIIPARKKQWPRPQAAVGTLDRYMVDHILGRKRPGRDRRRTLPTPEVPEKTKRGKFRASWRPATLLDKSRKGGKKGFLIELSRKRALLLKSPTKREAKRKGKPRKTLFFHAPTQRIEKRWQFERDAAHAIRGKYDDHFRRELILAMLKAKKISGVDKLLLRGMLRSL